MSLDVRPICITPGSKGLKTQLPFHALKEKINSTHHSDFHYFDYFTMFITVLFTVAEAHNLTCNHGFLCAAAEGAPGQQIGEYRGKQSTPLRPGCLLMSTVDHGLVQRTTGPTPSTFLRSLER